MKVIYYLLLSSLLFMQTVWSKEYHVSTCGNDGNPGTSELPFRTISAAAKVAAAGDIVTVHEGTYREWVSPKNGGRSDTERIVYQAAEGETVKIKGSERVSGWKKEKETVWKIVLPNAMFGDYNPYQVLLGGDWFRSMGRSHHAGEVFLNEKSLYEAVSKEQVYEARANENVPDTLGSADKWYCESNDETTTIWANFRDKNPNKELVEITVRRTCFYPEKQGIDYITLRGFDISQAATEWGPPTAGQIGIVATHWNKGWIIENNVIHDSKTIGISLGKEHGTGHNLAVKDGTRDGSVHYIEVVFNAGKIGWNKENIGSHIVRNNMIYNCEQAGICGSLGAIFSKISGNYIYNIWVKRQFFGAECAAIKLHAAIDVSIEGNHMHDCVRGIWLDWQAQGTRVTRNLMYDNTDDFFTEVNFGPILIDNNIMLSPISISDWGMGNAFVHNLIGGVINAKPDGRHVPYHRPHTTDMMGLTFIQGGDSRYLNNIFLPIHPAEKNMGLEAYANCKFPVVADGNVYYGEAVPLKKELRYIGKSDRTYSAKVFRTEDGTYLEWNADDAIALLKTEQVTTERLGLTVIPRMAFEHPDGMPLEINRDYFGHERSMNPIAGPFERRADFTRIKIW